MFADHQSKISVWKCKDDTLITINGGTLIYNNQSYKLFLVGQNAAYAKLPNGDCRYIINSGTDEITLVDWVKGSAFLTATVKQPEPPKPIKKNILHAPLGKIRPLAQTAQTKSDPIEEKNREFNLMGKNERYPEIFFHNGKKYKTHWIGPDAFWISWENACWFFIMPTHNTFHAFHHTPNAFYAKAQIISTTNIGCQTDHPADSDLVANDLIFEKLFHKIKRNAENIIEDEPSLKKRKLSTDKIPTTEVINEIIWSEPYAKFQYAFERYQILTETNTTNDLEHSAEKEAEWISLDKIAMSHESTANYAEALDFYTQALEIKKSSNKALPLTVSFENIARINFLLNNKTKALEYSKKAFEIQQTNYGYRTAMALNNISIIHKETGTFLEALKTQTEAYKILSKFFGKEHIKTTTYLHNVARTFELLKNFDSAEKIHMKALELNKNNTDTHRLYAVSSAIKLSTSYENQEKYDLAIKFQKQAYDMILNIIEHDHPTTMTIFNKITELYKKIGRDDELTDIYDKA